MTEKHRVIYEQNTWNIQKGAVGFKKKEVEFGQVMEELLSKYFEIQETFTLDLIGNRVVLLEVIERLVP